MSSVCLTTMAVAAEITAILVAMMVVVVAGAQTDYVMVAGDLSGTVTTNLLKQPLSCGLIFRISYVMLLDASLLFCSLAMVRS